MKMMNNYNVSENWKPSKQDISHQEKEYVRLKNYMKSDNFKKLSYTYKQEIELTLESIEWWLAF